MNARIPRLAATLALAAIAASLTACSSSPKVAAPQKVADQMPLALAKVDSAVFAALSACADEDQLDAFSDALDKDVELYHEERGVIRGRKALIADAKERICGKLRRERVGGLKVHPVKGYGAIAHGRMRVCALEGRTCDATYDYTIVWRQDGERWLVSRMLAYGVERQD